MTGRKESGTPWLHTTVILQPDIYRQALERGIDISDACNRALASLTGTEYRQKEQEEVPATPPVIIARDGSSPDIAGEPKKALVKKMPPVINADDPAAPARVVQAKVRPQKKDQADPPSAPLPDVRYDSPAAAPAAAMKTAAVKKSQTASPKKKAKGDALKTFFSSTITRTDDTGERVRKDELYELFARFCRDHRITPVPERKTVTVALKNQFALTEKMVDGTPCWTGIRLK